MSSTPVTSNNPVCISFPEELSRLDHEVTPAMEPLVSLLQKLAQVAPTAIRNKHKIYSIILRAREIENHLLAISIGAEVVRLETLDKCYKLIDSLEEHLLRTAEILVAEQGALNPELCLSWRKSREGLVEIMYGLYKSPFTFNQSSLEVELANNIFFDDCSWFSFLLHEGIEKEFALRFSTQTSPGTIVFPENNFQDLEWEIKHGHCTEEVRERAIDLATRLYESFSASTSENERDAASSVRQAKQSFIPADQDAFIKEGYKMLASVHSSSQPSTSVDRSSQPSTSVDRSSRPSTSVDRSSRPSTSVDRSSRPSRSVDRSSQPSTSVDRSSQPSTSVDRSSQPSRSIEAPERLWEKFYNYCRAKKVKFEKTVVNIRDDTKPEWVATVRVGDRSWTSSQPERSKVLASENVTKLILNDWATQPQSFDAPFPEFGASVVETLPGSSTT